ncbi:hypothetical protein AB4Y63_06035 [Leifsonia sp. YAF41]|uniref:hypothetical protein n=1 Tax=Leifsonia sp. YAF41 TaxID=3233086 RepID=UPI003F954963
MEVALHVCMLISALACTACGVLGPHRASVSSWLGQAIMVAAMLDMSVPGDWLPPLVWSALLIAAGMYGAARRRWSVPNPGSVCASLDLHRALTFVVAGGLILVLAGPAGPVGFVGAGRSPGGHAHAGAHGVGGATGWLLVGVLGLLVHAAWLVVRHARRTRRRRSSALEAASLGVMLAAMAASVL